jgi:uncharacterized membrane protein YccC
MVVSHALGLAPGAAALGAFSALLVDNGGPYRTRLVTMGTVVMGGAGALAIGALVPAAWAIAIPVTAAIAFGVIFARVLSQPVASTGVLILVSYFAGLGGVLHTPAGALLLAEMMLSGGLWTIVLSLVFWPLDPFRPARVSVALCYEALAEFATLLPDAEEASVFEWQRGQRVRLEAARAALAATAARAPARTTRARNLTVLLETSDLLLARTMRLTELADLARNKGLGGSTNAETEAARARLAGLAAWLARAERTIHAGLMERPADGGAAFGLEGSLRMEFLVRRREALGELAGLTADSLVGHIAGEEREALVEVEVAFDAVAAIWTGSEVRKAPWHGGQAERREPETRLMLGWAWLDSGWRDAVQANWTMQSAMLRHALRVMIVSGMDVAVMRLIHVNHGFWLPMTSIILLQPYSAGTARKSYQRVAGTVAGGLLAAVLAAAIPGSAWMTPVIVVLGGLTVATFAVDYAVYCFFLTPTFVLLSLPHAHDWRYAGVRVGTTLVGAGIALAAMRLLWPERAELELGGLLRRGAAADGAYLRALLQFWGSEKGQRRRAEREVLAVARRACGLASNDAEEAVDRVMQEPQFGALSAQELRLRNDSLRFATYLRRLTQSVTTLAVVGRATPSTLTRLERAAARMEAVAAGIPAATERVLDSTAGLALVNLAEEQMQRVERQVGILEKAGEGLRG